MRFPCYSSPSAKYAEGNQCFPIDRGQRRRLSRITPNLIASAAETAKEAGMEGKWIFTLHNPSVMPFLQYADNRDLREKIFKGYINRGNNGNEYDNKEVVRKLLKARLEKPS